MPGTLRRIHFISGLPRSGSTLLAAILRQNPRFHAEMTSPLGSIYLGIQERLGGRNEYHVALTDRQRIAVSRGVIENFYEDVSPDTLVFDTNRIWCANLRSVALLFPESKLICCVRPLSWILNSFEKLVQGNALEPSRIFNDDVGGTVYSRVETLMKANGPVAYAYHALRQAFYGPLASRLVLLNYESLARDPGSALKTLYAALDEAPFMHDFSHLVYQPGDYDQSVGMKGLHRVSGSVAFVEQSPILPPDLFNRYHKTEFWKGGTVLPAGMQAI